MLKSFRQFNESNSEDWLVKCLTEEEREKWLDQHFYENITKDEIKMFCDFIESHDENMEPMFKKHSRFPEPEISDVSVRYYFVTGSHIEFEKMEDNWYYIQTNIIRPTRYFVVDGKEGFEKFQTLIWGMREGTTDLDYSNVNEAKLFGQSDLYEEINQGRYQVLMSKHVKMTQSEVEQIKDELESFGTSLYLKDYSVVNSFGGSEQRHLIRAMYNGRVRIVITKIEDDYFLVRFPDEERYFRCDTIEGLFEIIEIYLS